MLVIRSIDEAIQEYEWIVGEPIDERTLTMATAAQSTEPDSIFTVYRFRVVKRFGQTKHPGNMGLLGGRALKEMSVRSDEVLVMKSGGNVFVDGVLLKKRGSPCFSELLPRLYLLALAMDTSGRIGWLAMGCRSIFMVDGDRLTPRDGEARAVALGLKERFDNSLAAFSRVFESPNPAR